MISANRQQDTAESRRRKAEIIRCESCNELVCQDSFCSACGKVWDMQGLVDFLIGIGAQTPEPPFAA